MKAFLTRWEIPQTKREWKITRAWLFGMLNPFDVRATINIRDVRI